MCGLQTVILHAPDPAAESYLQLQMMQLWPAMVLSVHPTQPLPKLCFVACTIRGFGPCVYSRETKHDI